MICLHCKKVIDDNKALSHPQHRTKFFCPLCKRLLHDFGREPSILSSPEKLDEFDKTPSYHNTPISHYYATPNIDEEILACKDALAFDENNFHARMTLAKMYFAKKETDLSLEETKKILDKEGYGREAMSFLAHIHAARGEYSSAAKCSLEILKREPDNTTVRYNFGLALFHLGDYSVAANQFYKVIKGDPKNEQAKQAFREARKYLIENQTDIKFNY